MTIERGALKAVATGWIVAVATACAWAGQPPLPFIENDYSGALARARAASLPLFVEVWAPW